MQVASRILVLVTLFGLGGQARAISHYELHVALDPARQHIAVTGRLLLDPADVPGDTVAFLLHRQLVVARADLGGGGACVRDTALAGIRYTPEATWVRCVPGRPLPADAPAELTVVYGGRITAWPEWNASVLGGDWVEMGLYFPWFPYLPDIAAYTYDLTVDAGPGYTVFALGTSERDGERWRFRTAAPTNDIVVVAARDLVVHRAAGVQVVHRGLEPALIDTLAADLQAMRALYTRWFGPVPGDLAVVSSSRERGGGYARRGALYLAGLADAGYLDHREGYHRYLGHELAHLWWHRADPRSWEDWLNESLAEHSALLAVRERFGEAAYAARLARKREVCADTPPIVGLDRDGDPQVEPVLYSKGPVLLAELEDQLGRAAYRALLREAQARAVATTAGFLALLRAAAGEATAARFEQQLRTR